MFKSTNYSEENSKFKFKMSMFVYKILIEMKIFIEKMKSI